MKKTIFTSILIMVAGFLLIGMTSGFSDFQGKKPWNVPDAAKSKKNTVASDASSIAAGKALWSTHCKSCHGAKGLGDGPKAAQLDTEPGDFSKASFQSQTDGALFYKTTEGRDDMPSFKKKISDADDMWSVINYIRTFKK